MKIWKMCLIILLCFSWIKHITILPCIDWIEHEVTGFEIKIHWNF